MADILGIAGLNRSGAATNKLVAAYENDIIDVSTGTGYGLNISSTNNAEFENFLDRLFYQNYNHTSLTFNGTVWSKEYVGRTMLAKYQKLFNSQLYLGNCKFDNPQAPLDTDSNAITFPSRVFYSDFFVGSTLTWGIDWGRNGRSTADSPYFYLNQSDAPLVQDFVANNIKPGDSLFITNGNAQLISKPYVVSSIESNYRLKLTENLPVTATGLHYWVGGNWFDVGTDDNDQITGFGKNSDRLLIFKLLSLWNRTRGQLRQVKDAIGTSSNRSIINNGGLTYYFHGSKPKKSGIYQYNGVNSVKISRAIDPWIRGMSTANYTSVVGWEEGEELRWYIGNLTNNNFDISITNGVASRHTLNQAWDVGPIADAITCATVYRTSNQEDTYCGTSDDQVLKMDSGNDFNTTAISSRLETQVYYPEGSEVINEYTRLQVIGRNVKGIRVKYKLWNKPNTVDDQYIALGELSEDRTELEIPAESDRFASGFQLEFDIMDTLEDDALIEKFTMFYKPSRARLL